MPPADECDERSVARATTQTPCTGLLDSARVRDSSPDSLISRLGDLFVARIDRWAETPLAEVCEPAGRFARPGRDDDAELLRHLWENRELLSAWLQETLDRPSREASWDRSPARFLRRRLVRWMHQRNQFLHIDDIATYQLDASYRQLLLDVARVLANEDASLDAVRAILAGHQASIATFLRGRLSADAHEVVCSEYPAPLQLGVLGLALEQLVDPILDVGCGASAQLVRDLRAHGRDAHGIDRDAPEDVATVADWMTYGFGDSRWGTIVSHLGFSLHFLHLHLSHSPRAFDHARVFMGMLRSLRLGGTFAYAPGLPFIESMLPAENFRVEHATLPRELVTPALQAVQEATGMTLEKATHVIRLG